ncbi:MAG: FAD-dependent oxidoreductase [Victivallaceae bacterium]|nr:FAD-dependent oxidoreductase [Victivallaceae bacterium]
MKKVVGAGGGPAGSVAALAAARNGAKTVLIERGECLGGVASSGGLSVWGPFDDGDRLLDWDRDAAIENGRMLSPEMRIGKRIIKGIPEEILARLLKMHGAIDYKYGFIPVNPELLKLVLEEMLIEAGVDIRYGGQIYDVSVSENTITSVFMADKSGSREIRGDIFIDATGDADIAALTGAPFEKGRKSDGKMQGVTLVFRLGGTDFPGRFYQSRENIRDAEIKFKEAYERGETGHLYQVGCINRIPGMDGVVAVNSQHSFNIDATRPEELKKAILTGRKECHELAALFRKYLKGFENSCLLDTAIFIGVRETRRIVGKYVITREDIFSAREFADSIGRNAYNIDIHIPETEIKGEICLKPGTSYSIPYRALLPQKTGNLLVAGRSISATHEAQSSLRIMPCCMVTGQAAGTAAALCAGSGVPPADLKVEMLQKKLREQNVCL